MRCAIYILLSLLLIGCTVEANQIEPELADTEEKLADLPRLKINTLVPTLGYTSQRMDTAAAGDQVTVTFHRSKPIDTVVLIPLNFLNNQNEYEASGFPVRFKIEAQTPDGQTICIADHTAADFPSPGIAPVVFNTADPRPAQSLRITVTKLAQEETWRSKKYIFALNELLVFSGAENIALNARVSAPNEHAVTLVFADDYLVDGHSYFPAVVPPENNPNRQFFSFDTEVRLFFDLGQERTFDEIRLYPSDFSPQFSHIHSKAVGFPKSITLRVSETDSFEDANQRTITQFEFPINISTAPLCKKPKRPVSGRYVQFTLKDGRRDPRRKKELIALSEIELLHNGTNLLHDTPFQVNRQLNRAGASQLSPTILTDGDAINGKIIPQKKWFLQLAQRIELERKKTKLLAQKEAHYTRQKKAFRTLLITLPFIGLLLLLFLLRNRYRHRKKIQAVRERIADDLHDEVGATLTGVANAAELLEEIYSTSSPKARELLAGITRNARRTAKETRTLIRFLEQKTNDSNLVEQFKITLTQMLSGMTVNTKFHAAAAFNALPPIQKWDLLLLFKEALNNIIKHADADTVEIRTFRQKHKLVLSITDNGKGLPDERKPTHLIKRAQKTGAKITFENPATAGTTIKCTLSR